MAVKVRDIIPDMPDDWLVLVTPLYTEGYNYCANQLRSDLGAFFAEHQDCANQAGHEWRFELFYCAMPRDYAVMFTLKYPQYQGIWQ